MRSSCLIFLILLLLLISGVLAQLSPPKTSKFKCFRNGCCDEHEWCRFWASIGECEANPTWMLVNCQLACNSCHAPDDERETITVTTELIVSGRRQQGKQHR